MAGTIFSLALSQRLDNEGRPLIDAPLYIYEANTSTPADAYMDFGLTVKHPWPMRTDSAGMLPAFWLADGQYKVRFTDPAGAIVYFDLPSVQAVGPSEGGSSGGGGSGVDPNAIFQTGDELWQKRTGSRAGWVRQNARTIGGAASGATERANADTQPLYEYLWNTYPDEFCPVVGGRGVSAAADFAANKAIATPDMRGYGARGLDDMGNDPAGRITNGAPTVAASSGGSEKHVISQANLPSANLTGTTSSDGLHSHNYTYAAPSFSAAPGGQNAGARSDVSATSGAAGAHSHNVTVALGGSATPLNTMDPYRLGTWYIKM